MKYLIVNGDDFGASAGVNRGIREAHENGILTSASLMVKAASAEPAARMASNLPNLSVGLHADVGAALERSASSADAIRDSLRSQLRRFEELLGRPPTHLDSHHNLHRDPRALPHFLELAHAHSLPLREHSPVRYCSKFYGQWGGATHLEQVSVQKFEEIVGSDVGEGITELSCHPGYVDADHVTSYRLEREVELRTLCDPRIRRNLNLQKIVLINYSQVPKPF